jgi:osmoprotectant transport system permease protein
MGMTGSQVLGRVEVPNALPLIFSGFRSATLQVIATATLAAVGGTGGLGRFLIDGQKIRDYPQMAGGALIVALLALAVDLVLSLVQRYAVSPGLTGRGAGPSRGLRRRSSNRAQGNTPLDVEIQPSQRTVETSPS